MMFGQFIEYKGHVGSIEYSDEDQIYFGQLLNIKDLVTYEGSTMEELYEFYHDAVDEYLTFLEELSNRSEQNGTRKKH